MFKTALIALALAHVALAVPTLELNPYVVNGTDANIVDRPYIVSIRSGTSHNCGGSILSSTWILSAAHCSGTSVQYGTDRISASGTNIVSIARWIRHENYSAFTLNNDIAVVQLAAALPAWSSNLQPTKLPPRFYEVPGNWATKAILVGFGLDKTGGTIQTRLQEVELLVASNDHCSTVHRNTVYPSNICAGIPEGGKGQCSGDSGGPLTLENGQQIGLVSWSEKPCTIAPYPGVYTKCSHHIDWIAANTGLSIP